MTAKVRCFLWKGVVWHVSRSSMQFLLELMVVSLRGLGRVVGLSMAEIENAAVVPLPMAAEKHPYFRSPGHLKGCALADT